MSMPVMNMAASVDDLAFTAKASNPNIAMILSISPLLPAAVTEPAGRPCAPRMRLLALVRLLACVVVAYGLHGSLPGLELLSP